VQAEFYVKNEDAFFNLVHNTKDFDIIVKKVSLEKKTEEEESDVVT
jgi:hypothetical protein